MQPKQLICQDLFDCDIGPGIYPKENLRTALWQYPSAKTNRLDSLH